MLKRLFRYFDAFYRIFFIKKILSRLLRSTDGEILNGKGNRVIPRERDTSRLKGLIKRKFFVQVRVRYIVPA